MDSYAFLIAFLLLTYLNLLFQFIKNQKIKKQTYKFFADPFGDICKNNYPDDADYKR